MGRDWYVIRTATRREASAVETLKEMGWATDGDAKPLVYMPVETRWHRFRDRKEPITRPLFPGYIFAELGRDDFAKVLKAEGVHNVICAHAPSGDPVPERLLPHVLITVRHMEFAGHFDRTARGAALKVGDAVRMIRGHFVGYFGSIKHMKEGERRLTVTLHQMGDMSVDIEAVEARTAAA